MRKGFTLIELLVVVAIVAVLAVTVLLTLNPSELLKQARDSNRLSDLTTLNTALAFYQASGGSSLGTANIVYVSLPDSSGTCGSWGLPTLPSGWTYSCKDTSTYTNADGTGWLPVNLTLVDAGTPLPRLPIDPTNTSSTGLYYTYVATSTGFEVSALPESTKYKMGGTADSASQDGGTDPALIEKGSNLTLQPVARDPGLVGYYKFDETSGTAGYDASGKGHSATLINAPTWTTNCKVGGCLSYNPASSQYVTTNFAPNLSNGFTFTGWVNMNNVVNQSIFGTSLDLQGFMRFVATTTWDVFWPNGAQTRNAAAGTSVVGTWTMLALIYDGSSNRVSFYRDGSLQTTLTVPSAQTGWSSNLWFGNRSGGGPFFNGYMDDLRVYNRTLSASEVTALYNATR